MGKYYFICCTNNLVYEKECRRYIEDLFVPEGMQLEINMLHEAKSMTAAYNEAMMQSNAKYKVSTSGCIDLESKFYI